jgi:integrase
MGTIEPYATDAGRRYRVRYRTLDRRQTRKRGFTTKRDPERYLAAVEVSKDCGQWMDPTKSRVTVAEWAEHWFRAQIRLKPTARSGYRHGLDKHVLPRWDTVRLSEVEHSEVQAWVNALAVNFAPSTVRQTRLALSGELKLAVEDRRIPQDPSGAVRLPRVVKKSCGYLPDGRIVRLAEACGQYADVVMILTYTGLRWGEMAGLKVRRLDIERRRIDVAEAV